MSADWNRYLSSVYKENNEFENDVFDLLLKCCSNNEERSGLSKAKPRELYDVIARNGIVKLDLQKESKIEIKRIGNSSNFKRFFYNNKRLENEENVVYIIDIDVGGLDSYLKSRGFKFKKVISYSDLLKIANNSKSIFLNPKPSTKCLQYKNIADYLTFCIRIKIVSAINLGKIIAPEDIDGDRNQFEYFDTKLTPFIYNDTISGKKYLFINNYKETQRTDIKNSFDKFDLIIKISIEEIEYGKSDFFLLKYENNGMSDSINIRKINESDLSSMLPLYNGYLGYEREKDYPIYKYRTFQRIPNRKIQSKRTYRTRKEAINFINKNTFDSISCGTLWFSNKEQINDPFDLDIRIPNAYDFTGIGKIATGGYQETNGQYSILCTSANNDNILLWSHYADSHKGICSEYYKNDLLNEVEADSNISLCIYGEVEYLKKRPDFTPMLQLIPYVVYDLFLVLFNIRCLFSKYQSWSYEGEIRFAIMPTVKDIFMNGYGGIKLMPNSNYYGQRLDFKKFGVYFRTGHLNPVNTFDISANDYYLIPVKKNV